MEGDSDTFVSVQWLIQCVFPPFRSPLPYFPLPLSSLRLSLLSLLIPFTSLTPQYLQIRRLTLYPHLDMRYSPTLQNGVPNPLPSYTSFPFLLLPSCPFPSPSLSPSFITH